MAIDRVTIDISIGKYTTTVWDGAEIKASLTWKHDGMGVWRTTGPGNLDWYDLLPHHEKLAEELEDIRLACGVSNELEEIGDSE